MYLCSSLSCVSVPKFWKCMSKLENLPLDFCRNDHIWGFASVLLTEGIWMSLDTKNLVFYNIYEKEQGLKSCACIISLVPFVFHTSRRSGDPILHNLRIKNSSLKFVF